jgi:hypothetical protein
MGEQYYNDHGEKRAEVGGLILFVSKQEIVTKSFKQVS